jgi:hypothetical protein
LSKPPQQQLFIPSAVLAWVFPGLGYLHRGQTLRGLLVMASVGTLILVGVLVGGIQVCDATHNPVAGMVQRGSLPGVILNVVASKSRSAQTMSLGGEFSPTLMDSTGGKPEEIGLIFTAVAGFLNLMAIVGSLTPLPKETDPEADAGADASTAAATPGSPLENGPQKAATQGEPV